MLINNVPDLNLDLTIDSGQVFLWNKVNGVWYGVERGNIIKIGTNEDGIECSSYPSSIDYRDIFRLDDDLNYIASKIAKDPIIRDALTKMKGLRLMRQDPYQCMISFICATNTSISMIKRMLTNMSMHFGNKVEYDNLQFHTFPEPKELANASINELRKCSVGYRARFIKRAAKAVLEGKIDFDYLKRIGYENAKIELMGVLGVGQKVADCILLFSLEKLGSFPIDVWIARAVTHYYADMFEDKLEKKKMTPRIYRMVSSKMRQYFGTYAGYAQQYLYCYSRNNIQT